MLLICSFSVLYLVSGCEEFSFGIHPVWGFLRFLNLGLDCFHQSCKVHGRYLQVLFFCFNFYSLDSHYIHRGPLCCDAMSPTLFPVSSTVRFVSIRTCSADLSSSSLTKCSTPVSADKHPHVPPPCVLTGAQHSKTAGKRSCFPKGFFGLGLISSYPKQPKSSPVASKGEKLCGLALSNAQVPQVVGPQRGTQPPPATTPR